MKIFFRKASFQQTDKCCTVDRFKRKAPIQYTRKGKQYEIMAKMHKIRLYLKKKP